VIINFIITEDEPLALEQLEDFVKRVTSLKLLKSFVSGLGALGFLKSNKVDLILLDVQMDELTGIQLLESLEKHPKVIMTTAFDKYAVKGFELNVNDYLLKPYPFERFLQSVDRVHGELINNKSDSDSIFVKTEYRLERVCLNKILFIEGMRDYRRIHLIDKNIMTLQTFTDFEKQLPSNQFCRVHKSYLITLDKIESIEKDRIKIGKELLPISDTYKKQFYDRINR
jgi:two-component system LytT family response regulator